MKILNNWIVLKEFYYGILEKIELFIYLVIEFKMMLKNWLFLMMVNILKIIEFRKIFEK